MNELADALENIGTDSDWRTWKAGRKTIYHVEEFGRVHEYEGIITEVHPDYLVFKTEGFRGLPIEDWNSHMFL